jgi:hypothetical protein
MPPKSMKRRLDPALRDELDREAEKTKRRKMGPSMETPSKSKPKQEQLAALKVLLAEGVLVTTQKNYTNTRPMTRLTSLNNSPRKLSPVGAYNMVFKGVLLRHTNLPFVMHMSQ